VAIGDKMNDLRGRWDRLSDRERAMVSGLGAAFLVLGVIVVGFSISGSLGDLEEANHDMRTALSDIAEHRDSYQRAKAKTAQLEVRMGHGGVQLQGFLEQASKDAGVEIAETTERQPAPAGKKYVERAVDLRLRPVGIDALAKFLRRIETGPNLVAVTGLAIRSRDDKHESLEVEMTVSTYEHGDAKTTKKKENKG
jgi:hypothetical protein